MRVHKKDLHVLGLGMGDAIIFDDRKDVWIEAIQKSNGGIALFEARPWIIRNKDSYLWSMMNILELVLRSYLHINKDRIGLVVSVMKKKVLEGVILKLKSILNYFVIKEQLLFTTTRCIVGINFWMKCLV